MRCIRLLIPSVLALGLLAAPTHATEGAKPAAQPPAPLDGRTASAPLPAAVAQPETAALSPLGQAMATWLLLTDAKAPNAEREDRAALIKFYEARRYEPVWVAPSGLSPAGAAVVAEIAKADDWGLDASALRPSALPETSSELTPANRADAEVQISLAVLRYARHARGGRVDPTSLSKYIDRKLPLIDPSRVIDEVAKAPQPDAYLRGLHPQHPQFELLRQQYLALKRGKTNAQTEAAPPVAAKAGSKKAAAAPAPPSLRKLLANMEQWRWMPESLGDYYVWVNVPEFTIRIVKGGKVVHSERVIVGKTDTQTPIFSDAMEQVIFHPFWGVPDSIKRNEILPSLARGSTSVLSKHNLRIQRAGRDIDPESVDWTTTDIRNFHVYQPPGGGNVLGVVKFRFPNKHDVYMHDTPTKNLFNADVRAFSHGCMRVRNPERLAELLLGEDQGWAANRIASAINGGPQNNQINLRQKFPVHITYFTAAVDGDGKLKQFADLYGHENRIALGLEGKMHLIAIARAKEDKAPVRTEAVGSLAETRAANAKNDWKRQVFGNN